MYNELNGIYLGKVILNSDIADANNERPLGRVKVLIHGVTYTDTNIRKNDFETPIGSNVDKTASPKTLQYVKDYEAWAYVLQPIAGGGASRRYNAQSNNAIASDADFSENTNSALPPAALFPLEVADSFTSNKNGSAGINPNAYAYRPDNRSNAAKGMFALPAVGSTVLVGFINGSRGMPIVLGVVSGFESYETVHGCNDTEGVFPNYPLAYSNIQ